MPEPGWIEYVAIGTGVITGIAGAIMGYVSYRRSNSFKSLDLRMELKKAVNTTQSGLQGLEKLIEYAFRSRRAVASAKGTLRSGMTERWAKEIEEDTHTVKLLFQNARAADENYDELTPKELESRLVEVHRLQVQIDQLRSKYEAAVRADDEERNHIKEDARARHTPK